MNIKNIIAATTLIASGILGCARSVPVFGFRALRLCTQPQGC